MMTKDIGCTGHKDGVSEVTVAMLSSVSVRDTGYFLVSLSFLADAERHGPVERHALTSLFPDH